MCLTTNIFFISSTRRIEWHIKNIFWIIKSHFQYFSEVSYGTYEKNMKEKKVPITLLYVGLKGLIRKKSWIIIIFIQIVTFLIWFSLNHKLIYRYKNVQEWMNTVKYNIMHSKSKIVYNFGVYYFSWFTQFFWRLIILESLFYSKNSWLESDLLIICLFRLILTNCTDFI